MSVASQATVKVNVHKNSDTVPVDRRIRVEADNGTLSAVRVMMGPKSTVRGRLSHDGSQWTARDRLEPGRRYRVFATAADEEGRRTRPASFAFRTADLTLDQQTFPSIAPLAGETVGVGMPVIVQFDVPVADRARIERHLSVDSSPHQAGTWSWLSNTEVHWRPRHFWKPGTRVTVNADVNSIGAGRGVFGQVSRSSSFSVGDAVISRIDVPRHQMRVFRNGSLLRVMPVTAGKAGFTTRSGTKVIIEKVRHKVMDSSTIGIGPGDSEYYRLDVEYAMRVTYSGEFVHGAPWSEGSQGSDNVSHGCVGMSMTNAAWLFDLSKRGDVVQVTGTDRSLEPGNGYTDWNIPFSQFREGSALS